MEKNKRNNTKENMGLRTTGNRAIGKTKIPTETIHPADRRKERSSQKITGKPCLEERKCDKAEKKRKKTGINKQCSGKR